MTDKAQAGWVVQVTVPAPPPPPEAKWSASRGRAAPSFRYFNVAIGDALKALAATAKHLAEPEEGEMRVVRGLSSEEIAALSLVADQVKPA
jgi:hypothetical protein